MKTWAIGLAGLALFGGGVVASNPSSIGLSKSNVNSNSPIEAHMAPGQQGGGEMMQSAADMAKVRQELQKRTYKSLGITQSEILDARIKAIESMVDDSLITKAQGDRMIERTKELKECLAGGKTMQECRPNAGGQGQRGGMRQRMQGGQGMQGGGQGMQEIGRAHV